MIPLRDDNPNQGTPILTWTLIAANIIIWFLSLADSQTWTLQFGLIPWELLTGRRLPESELIGGMPSIFSSMFMHGGFMHLAGNMLYLWIFGDNVEDALGTPRFLLFYVGCGIAAALMQVGAVVLTATIPADPVPLAMIWQGRISPELAGSFVPMVGASGAIAGVLGAYAFLYPRARVTTLIPLGFFLTTVRLPALFLIGFWFVLQLCSGLGSATGGGGVAWWAHVGGFVAGIGLLLILGGGGKRKPRARSVQRGQFGEPKW